MSDDHYVTSLQEEVAHLRATLKTAQTQIAQLSEMAALAHKYEKRAFIIWREGNPQRPLKHPDRTDLMVWLVGCLDHIRQRVAGLGVSGAAALEIIDEVMGGHEREDKS